MPPEPRLRDVAAELLERGVTGHELARLEDAWFPLLEPFPWDGRQAEGLRQRGELLFGIGARLLGASGDAAAAGACWSLADGALHCSDPQSRDLLLAEAREQLKCVPHKVPARLRPLTVLSALAAHDVLHRRGSRAMAALRHRLFDSLITTGLAGTASPN